MKKTDTYILNIAGLERRLPVIEIAPGLSIASFVMLGDTELVEASAESLFRRPDFPRDSIDILVCPEAKAIALTHALACRIGVDYVVLRKTEKSYMQNYIVEQTKSITTSGDQRLVLDGPDKAKLAGKRVCLVDDVVSTGGSIKSMEKLLSGIGCTIVAKTAVLLEEGGYHGRDLIYLEKLPVFRN